MGLNQDVFYDESRIAIIPMRHGYPGRGKGGDMPPLLRHPPCFHNWIAVTLDTVIELYDTKQGLNLTAHRRPT